MSVRKFKKSRTAQEIASWIKEISSYTSGKIGLALLIFFIAISIYALVTLPPNFRYIWNNPRCWHDYPELAPPAWVRLLGYQKAAHKVTVFDTPSRIKTYGPYRVFIYSTYYDLDVKDYPQDLIFEMKYVKVPKVRGRVAPVILRMYVKRPDHKVIKVIDTTLYFPSNTSIAYINQSLSISADRKLIVNEVIYKLLNNSNVQLSPAIAVNYVFGKLKIVNQTKVSVTPLEGTYRVYVELHYPISSHIINPAEYVRIVIVGNCYGILGTDNIGRDLAQAILYGFPVALMIGFITAVASTLLGLFAGVISAYYGGLVDELLQRLIDVIGNIPLLPFLILLVDVTPVAYRLHVIMLVLIVFGWGGLAITVRAMTLSIKEEPYIEAARAIGASNARIILRHIIPQIIPYATATLVFSVPSAILSEAGLSVLGLEHGWPTWGRILAAARMTGRYDVWWWILPPGFLLALTSLTFVLLGMAIETIVEPRLRTR